ncbi:ABC transporter permease [Halothiobacillus sp.]|uniref:ABC transporter permease n=1 Tax=Halothiobacillus sp. TaxID=1891311 RepID=UPI00262C635B|nr:ABC transporter permease [Halothiobacillus sp.]
MLSNNQKPKRVAPSPGVLFSIPGIALLLFGFIVPLLLIVVFSFMPAKTFGLGHMPTLQNYNEILGSDTYITSLLWSLFLAGLTTAILLVVCYPLAFAMAKIFNRGATLITLAVVLLLFVSENIRLFGWSLTLMKGGVFDGTLKQFGLGLDNALYNVPVIVFGMSYVYLPFMLFPLVLGISMIPDQVREAANDLGANWWLIFRSIDLPLSSPGILIGSLLTFVLSVGAVSEAKILGGGKVIPITQNIESIFSYAQNWPLGSALSTALLLIIGGMLTYVLSKVELDRLFRK